MATDSLIAYVTETFTAPAPTGNATDSLISYVTETFVAPAGPYTSSLISYVTETFVAPEAAPRFYKVKVADGSWKLSRIKVFDGTDWL